MSDLKPAPLSGAPASESMKKGILENLRAGSTPSATNQGLGAGAGPEQLARDIVRLDPARGEAVLCRMRDALAGSLSDFECYQTAEALAEIVYPKYKFSEYDRIFLEDEAFIAFYRQFMDIGNWHSLDRKYTLREMLKLVAHLHGDIAECGTYKGFSAYLMCQALEGTSNSVHLFDSFEGLSDIESCDGTYWVRGKFAVPEDHVHETLDGFNNYSVYKGWIPDRFHEVQERSFRFVHIDVDLYRPTYDALEFFYPRLVQHGIILLDDHGSGSCPGAKIAADEFISQKPEQIALLTTGQAFIIKQ